MSGPGEFRCSSNPVVWGARVKTLGFVLVAASPTLIPGARLVALDGRNHLLLRDEPAWGHFVRELEAVVAPADAAPATEDAGLSEREEQVLARVAQGRTNDEIGAELVLSVRPVEHHLSNLYVKLRISAGGESGGRRRTDELRAGRHHSRRRA